MKKIWIHASALALIAAAGLSFAADDTKTTAALGSAAPGFTLADQNGKSVSLSDYKGKIIVLEWVNEDCPICNRHLVAKTTEKVAEKWKDKGVVFLDIDSTAKHNAAARKETVEKYGLSYPVLDDSAGTVGHMYNAMTTPHLFIINTDGTLVYNGAIDDDTADGSKPHPVNYVEKALTELAAGKPVSTPETKPYGCTVKYKE